MIHSWYERAVRVGLDPSVTSLVLDTNRGGTPVTVCVCGMLGMAGMMGRHVEQCEAFQSEVESLEREAEQ